MIMCINQLSKLFLYIEIDEKEGLNNDYAIYTALNKNNKFF